MHKTLYFFKPTRYKLNLKYLQIKKVKIMRRNLTQTFHSEFTVFLYRLCLRLKSDILEPQKSHLFTQKCFSSSLFWLHSSLKIKFFSSIFLFLILVTIFEMIFQKKKLTRKSKKVISKLEMWGGRRRARRILCYTFVSIIINNNIQL